MPQPFLHYDVFTRELLRGNQLAVFTDARGLDTATMQAMAREMNFSESTFILPAEDAATDVRMRIFTPHVELPMAGHPTVGSTFALAHSGVIAPRTARVVFGLNIGPTPVDMEWDGDRLRFAWMTQQNPTFGDVVVDRAATASALSVDEADLADYPVQQVSCGVPYLLVPLRDRAAVDRAMPDASALRRLGAAIGGELPVFLFAITGNEPADIAPQPSATTGSGAVAVAPAAASAYSRMFAPNFGITEDPATGSASGPLGCYLVRHGLVPLDAARIVSTQGVAMGRRSEIHIDIRSSDAAISSVRVGGEAVLAGRGELFVNGQVQ